MEQRLLRIGLITPEYPGIHGPAGGIGAFTRSMANLFVEAGHYACVILPTTGPEERILDGDLPIYKVATMSRAPFPFGYAILGRRLATLARDLNLDLVEAPEIGGFLAMLAAFKPRYMPLVVRLQGGSAIMLKYNQSQLTFRSRVQGIVQNWLERKSILSADVLITTSKSAETATRRLLRLNDHERSFAVIPNSPDRTFFLPASSNPGSTEPLIVSVGMLELRKGADLLVRALPIILSKHPSARLLLVGADLPLAPGGGSMTAYLSGLVPEALRRRVVFAGDTERSRVRDFYHAADVCVFPSRWESCPIACLEAMACGRPIVVSPIPAMREIVEDRKTALIAESETPEAYASAIDLLLSNRTLAANLGTAAQKEVLRRAEPTVVAQATLRTYREALQAKERARNGDLR